MIDGRKKSTRTSWDNCSMIYQLGETCVNYTLAAKQYIATPGVKLKLLEGGSERAQKRLCC